MSSERCLNFIMAGGLGERLLPLTLKNPKPLLPVGTENKCIDFSLLQSISSELDIAVSGYYLFNSLLEYLKSINYSGTIFKDSRICGDGTISEHLNSIEHFHPKEIIVSPADHVHNVNYQSLLEFHRHKKSQITLVGIEPTCDPNHRVRVASNGKAQDYFVPDSEICDILHAVGIYCVDFELLKLAINQRRVRESKIDIKDLFISLISDGCAYVYRHDGFWRDIGTLDRYYEENINRSCSTNGNLFVGHNVVSEKASVKKCVLLGEVEIGDDIVVSDAIINTGTVINNQNLEAVNFKVTEKDRKVISL